MFLPQIPAFRKHTYDKIEVSKKSCEGPGISHLTFARKDFKAQVPDWVKYFIFNI